MKFDRIPEIAKYLSVVFFLYWITAYTVWNFLPIYFEQHMSVFWVGVLTSLFAFVPVLIDIPVGNLVQRSGERVVIFAGFVVGVLPSILYLTAVPVLLGAAKVCEGVMKSLVWSGSWSVSMKSADEDYESEALSVFLLGLQLAAVMGPVIGGYLIMSHGFQLPILIWLGGSMLTLLVFYVYIGLEGKRGFFDSMNDLFERNTYSNDIRHLKENWSGVKLPIALIFLHSIVFSFFWLAIPLMLERMGADFVTMGLVFGAAALPRTFQFVFGDLGDRVGQLKVTVVLALLVTPVLFVMGIVGELYILAGFYLVAMTLISGFTPVLHSVFDRNVPEAVESEMVGFLELFKHSGQALGPFMAGTVASVWSLNASFIVAAGISAVIFLVAAHSLQN